MEIRRLGSTDLEITPIGLGCMQFTGNRGMAGWVFAPLAQDAVTEVVRAARDGGINWFDTAELYGRGRSERTLTSALAELGVAPGEVRIATKWLPWWRTAGSIGSTLDARLACLQGYPIDLHQIHMPVGSLSPLRAQLREMARLLHAGRVRAIGVSNFSARQMAAAHRVLAAEGVALAANQVRLSLLHRGVERNGVLATARRLGVTLIAYSPLASGLLTGRFHQDPAQARSRRLARRVLHGGARGLARSRPLIDELRAIGQAYGASPTQVALSWLVSYYGETVVAIPGASKPEQATEAAAAMSLRLNETELARLDQASRRIA